MNSEILELFCQAVCDVGVFSWWSASADGKFQVEFSGTQLWMPPLTPDGPPCGTIALRFEGEVQRFFLRKGSRTMAVDWPEQLQADALRPLRLTPGSMKLFYGSGSEAWLEEVHGYVEDGFPPDASRLLELPARMFFWAGEVGVAVASRRLALVSHAGDLDWQEVPSMVSAWWSYWERYWQARETSAALAWDYACEVTIPVTD